MGKIHAITEEQVKLTNEVFNKIFNRPFGFVREVEDDYCQIFSAEGFCSLTLSWQKDSDKDGNNYVLEDVTSHYGSYQEAPYQDVFKIKSFKTFFDMLEQAVMYYAADLADNIIQDHQLEASYSDAEQGVFELYA